ncbi:MAG: diguanylate cyclase, partial [Chloroflexi bacterium]|nr:diguanylate cyclase [Chloroflexota bacterium]
MEPIEAARAAFGLLGTAMAVLSSDGAISYANEAWLRPENASQLIGPSFGPGVKYAEAVRARAQRPDEPAAILAAAIDHVLQGHRGHFETDYSEEAGAERRWFRVRVVRTPEPPAVVVVYEDITAYKVTEQALEHRALHDGLTDLPNRTLFVDRLEQAMRTAAREHKALGIIMMDLDRFKDVNDTFGHEYGDLLLQQVGQRIRDALRQSDTLGRMGGDEFGILLTGITQRRQATIAARKVLSVFETPFRIEGQSLDVGASLGIAMFPLHAQDGRTALRLADLAMYQAKREGGGYVMYEPAPSDTEARRRLTLMSGFRQALERDELILFYQPKVAIGTGEQAGVEALVRWQHPEHGLLSPDDFVPLVERTGLTRSLTHWVINAALRQCRAWQQDGLDLTVAVNLTIRDLQDPE